MDAEKPKTDVKAEERKLLYERHSWRSRLRSRIKKCLKTFSLYFLVGFASWTKRTVDFLTALTLAVLLSPIILPALLLTGGAFHRTPRLGRWCGVFDEFSFNVSVRPAGPVIERFGLKRLPVLLNIMRGDMSFVGPLPASPGDLSPQQKVVRKRYNVRPGLISLWWIRRRGNVDYGTELEADAEYVEDHSIRKDLGIALRAIPAILYGEGVSSAPDELTLLGIPIDNVTMSDALDTVLQWTVTEGSRQVCFVNADCANISYLNTDYRQALQDADLCLADGIGIKLAGKLLGRHVKQNVNGTDMFPLICERLSDIEGSVFLLGARDYVVQGVADWIGTNFPRIRLCGLQHGYYSPEEEREIINRIKESETQLLLVAFGSPKQDLWIKEHLAQTGARVALGVGGLFDFYSGRLPRAPLWMREIGMEWVYRLIQEPGRLWKRYLIGNGVFLWRVLMERIRGT
jgi:N-acetylglucosaminyldiphosphoundecaprenol N-acetyl-beta-D-mannosaminyltransferase